MHRERSEEQTHAPFEFLEAWRRRARSPTMGAADVRNAARLAVEAR